MSGLLIAGSHGVPTQAPAENFVGPDYQRFDGFEPLDADYSWSDVVGSPVRPGGWGDEALLPEALPGKVGSIDATPLPVADCIHKPENAMVGASASRLTTQFNTGPGGANPGLDDSLFLQFVNDNPPQPDSLESIFLGG